MEALLREVGDGLALGSSGDGPQCRSAGELKNKIAQLFGGKVSDTRAERVSASFEIPADVVLNLSDVSHDPNSAGPDQIVTTVQTSSAVRSFFTVREVVVDQPDAGADPIAQKAVAAFLMIHVRQADGSVWGVQSTSRATQGWTASYVCQHSMACWKMARQRKHIVGLSTTDDMLDIASLSRPAFDCRGVVNITFSRFSRSVVVKYEHTNFHRSVSDLVQLFPPPRPPSPLPLPAPAPGSTNKRTKAVMDGQDGSGTTPKRKRPRKSAAQQAAAPQEGDGAVPPATGGGEAATAAAAVTAAAATTAEAAGAPGQEATPGAKPKKPRNSRKPSEKKRKTIAAADGSAGTVDVDATGAVASGVAQGVTSIATAAVDAMMDLGIDVNPSGDLNEGEVAEALLQHLHELPEDNTGTAAAMMDALAEHASASEANWQLSNESEAATAAAAAAAAAAATTSALTEASSEDPGATTEQICSSDQSAVAAAPSQSQTEATGNTEAERPRPYMRVTEAEVPNARKATAIKLLSDRSVEPGTLTHEQFCTFANQAPVLQKESLELLAHYGAERLAIVPASNNWSNSNTQSPTPAHTADGAGLAQASTMPQPTQQTHVPPPAAVPVPDPAPAPAAPETPASSAKPTARKRPAKKTQSKAAAAAAAAEAKATAAAAAATALTPDHTVNTVHDTGLLLPGLRGGESARSASWLKVQQSSWQAQQQQQNAAAVAVSGPGPAKGGSRRKSNATDARQSTATAPSTTPTHSQALPLPTQVSPVPPPATAYPRESFASAAAAPVSAIVEKPAKAPRKPRAPRQRKPAATVPLEEDDSPVLSTPGLAQPTTTAADTTTATYRTSGQEQPASTDYYTQQTQQTQQYPYQPAASSAAGQRTQQTGPIMSPPKQAASSLASYQTSNQPQPQQFTSGVSYNNQPAAIGASTGAENSGSGYSQYNNHGRYPDNPDNSGNAASMATAVTTEAAAASTAAAQPLLNTYLSDYQRPTGASSNSSYTSTTGATYTTAATATSNQWPTAGGDNGYSENYMAQQQRHRSQQQQQQQQQQARTTTPVGYSGLPRPSDIGYAQLLQQQQSQQSQQSQQPQQVNWSTHGTGVQQQPARAQSHVTAYGATQSYSNAGAAAAAPGRSSHSPTNANSTGYRQGPPPTAAAAAAPLHHLGSNTGYQQQAQQYSVHRQAQHRQTQPYQQQQQQQHQTQPYQHQPYPQQQQNQQQRVSMGLGGGRNAYGNQVLSEEMYEMIRR